MERTCVGCGGKGDPGRLVRVCAGPDGRAVADGRRRMGGRGAWLHPDPACLARAVKRRSLPRALRLEGLQVDAEALQAAVDGNRP